jgi:hypothetical protein
MRKLLQSTNNLKHLKAGFALNYIVRAWFSFPRDFRIAGFLHGVIVSFRDFLSAWISPSADHIWPNNLTRRNYRVWNGCQWCTLGCHTNENNWAPQAPFEILYF